MRPTSNKSLHRSKKTSDWRVPRNQNNSKPSGAWRKKYKCKKLKGDHQYVLIKPRGGVLHRHATVEEYYRLERERMQKRKEKGGGYFCCVLIHHECTACGHTKLDMER